MILASSLRLILIYSEEGAFKFGELMRKVVVMLDGSFVLKVLSGRLSQRPTAEQAYEFAMACVDEGDQEELLRIYYYDCPPYGSTEVHPLSGASINFSA